MKIESFQDIPQFPSSGYEVSVGWTHLEEDLKAAQGHRCGQLDLNPDFQRPHVWTPDQQVAWVEYQLMGGEAARTLYFNYPGWMTSYEGPYQLIDGKQRLEAAMAFMRGDIRAFGNRFQDFRGHWRVVEPRFTWKVFALKSRAEVLRLYLAINAGGTPHSADELNRVRALLALEEGA